MPLRYYSKFGIIITFFLCLTFFFVEAIAGEPFEIKIEAEYGNDSYCFGGYGAMLGQHAYVSAILNRGSEVMLGYDFLIAYDNTALISHGAFANPEIYDTPGLYEWEYFSYNFVDDGGGLYPSGLIQIVSIADQNNGTHHPIVDANTGQIKLLPENTILFKIDFLVTNDYTMECSFIPLNFFWRDCTDNSIAMINSSDSTKAVIQAISKDVFGYNGSYFSVTDLNATFPTYFGTPNECLEYNPDNPPLRFVNFKNGGIKIMCSEGDGRGDINLDGIHNSIEDIITFANYFVYGREAFNINFEGQKASTDVNADGIPLSITDFVYMTRLSTMDVSSLDMYTIDSSGIINASEYSDSLVIESSFDIALGAALFTFENVTQPYDLYLGHDIADMNFKSNLSGDTLKVLIYGIEQGRDIPAGTNNLLKIDHFGGRPKLISSEAAGYYGERLFYKTSATQIPDQLFLSQNYPNPFNSSTQIEFSLTKPGQWIIDIFNITGQKVKILSANDPAGPVQIFWDATDENGQLVSTGVYFYRLTFENQSITKKMLLIK